MSCHVHNCAAVGVEPIDCSICQVRLQFLPTCISALAGKMRSHVSCRNGLHAGLVRVA
jgi:hypothetical protein